MGTVDASTPQDADLATIKQAYRTLSLKWHPDKNKGNEDEASARFVDISKAYDAYARTDVPRRPVPPSSLDLICVAPSRVGVRGVLGVAHGGDAG